MTKFQEFKCNLKHLWEKITRPFWIMWRMRPLAVRSMFYHTHLFKDFDPEIVGIKYAILYGRLYFEESKYTNGTFDRVARSRQVDKIMKEYYDPADRLEYIKLLHKTRKNVLKANELGFFSVGDNAEQNAIEAAHYQMAMDSLDLLITACAIYSGLWEKIFRQPFAREH